MFELEDTVLDVGDWFNLHTTDASSTPTTRPKVTRLGTKVPHSNALSKR